VVKSSTGVMNVVALGPKLAKKNVSACAAPRRAARSARLASSARAPLPPPPHQQGRGRAGGAQSLPVHHARRTRRSAKMGECKQSGPALTYRTMNSQMEAALICTYAAARMMRMVVMMMKPAGGRSSVSQPALGPWRPPAKKAECSKPDQNASQHHSHTAMSSLPATRLWQRISEQQALGVRDAPMATSATVNQ